MIPGSLNTAIMGGGVSDPFFDDVVSLLHMDGPDASTTFTDEKGVVWTANGNAQIDTAQSKFGGASGLFDGTGDYITTPDSADFTFGTSDFTIEYWVRMNAAAGASGVYVFGQMSTSFAIANGSVLMTFGASSTAPAILMASGSSFVVNISSSESLTLGVWYHVAATRSGNTFRLFVNGVQRATTTNASSANNSTHPISIGRPGAFNGAYFNGWLDDFRLTIGTARYTAGFTPPARAFPDN